MGIFDFLHIKKRPWEKFYTREELHFKVPDDTMYEAFSKSALDFNDLDALEYFGKRISYKKMLKKIDRCAKAFVALGVKKGDIVTICMPNTPEVLISLYALNKIGAVAHMVHPLSSEEEIKDFVNETKSKYAIVIDMCYEKINNLLDKTKLKKVIFVSVANSMPIYLHIGYNLTKRLNYKCDYYGKVYTSWNRFILGFLKNKKVLKKRLGKNTPAVILHSGGTSGKPKYVVIPNRAFTSAAIQGNIVMKNLKPHDRALAIMPNFHGFGLSVCMHTSLYIGCCTILVPQFNAKEFDKLLHKTKPSIVLGVPTLYEALTKSNNVPNLDLSSLKYIISGGDQLSKVLEDRINSYLEEHNCAAKVTQGYGLSEALAAVCICTDDRMKSGSIGIPFPKNDMKIINPSTRKTVKTGEVGEICISGPTVMLGYLNNEKESNEALQVHSDNRVWLHTGDMGYMDKDGFIFYEQRIKRMIISSGYNVYPSHVEEVIERHPDVLQCSVVGMPHPYKQEVVKAFIVLKDGVDASILKKSEIKNFCKKNLSHYMCPYKYVFRKSIPYTKLGKVDFKTLQEDDGDDDV